MVVTGHSTASTLSAAVDRFVEQKTLRRSFRTTDGCWLFYKSIEIDRAYCLSLPRRVDRRAAVRAQFQTAGLLEKVRFFDAVDGRTLEHPRVVSNGQAGCTESHLRAMQEAAKSGARHLLLFEDDVELVPDFSACLDTALARCPATYDLFYLGALCVPEWNNFIYPFDDCVARAGHVWGTHAYIVNLKLLPRIEAALAKRDQVIDQFFLRELLPASNCYACVPYLAFQLAGVSDVAEVYNANTRAYSKYVWR